MKRLRAPNFTTAEILNLLTLVEKYPIIENKKTDGATTKEKQDAWENLTAEYNSQTSHTPRTLENLIACYKNQKIKVKKLHSNEKMTIKAPLLLLNAVEEHGQDWDRVAQATNATNLECQMSFKQLVKDMKKEEALEKKELNRTGGGPAPQPSCSYSDPVLQKVKNLIGPALEGMYTVYDGDADFMKEQQSGVSCDLQIKPIECSSPIVNDSTPDLAIESQLHKDKRLNIMKRKVDPSLESLRKGKKKVAVTQSFQELAEDKKELVKAQKILIDLQIEHQKLLNELAHENLEYTKKKHQYELNLLKNKTN